MQVKVSMLIMSALSDAQHLVGIVGTESRLYQHINWAKWLTLNYPNNEVEISPEIEYKKFTAKFPIRKMQMG